MSDLENNIMDKKFSFSVKDIKWIISTLVVVIGWVITIVFWVQDKNRQKARIEVLETKNGNLEVQVATLNGQISGVNQATKIFMENPPSETKFRVELLEKRVEKIEQLNNINKFTEISVNKPIRRDR